MAKEKLSGSSKIAKPHLIPMARFIRSLIEEGGETVNNMAKRLGINNSTLSNVVHAYYPPSSRWVGRLVEELDAIDRRLHGSKAQGITTDSLLGMILPEDLESKPKKVLQVTRMDSSTVLHHLRRLSFEERQQIWPHIFDLAAKDAREKPKEDLQPLVDAIAETMDAWAVTTLEDFAEQLLAEQGIMDTHRDYGPLLNGLRAIVERQELPRFLTDEFATALDYLSTAIADGQFEGDINALLSYYLGGEATADQPVEV